MRTVVVQGGWRVWAMLIVGGALLLAVGLIASLFLLGAAVVGALALLGYRALYALGLAGRKAGRETPASPSDGIVDADFQVVGQRMLPEHLESHAPETR
jgi:hypothetical protein